MSQLEEKEQFHYKRCTLFSENHPMCTEDYITKYYYFTLLYAVLEPDREFSPFLNATMKVYQHHFGITDEDYVKVANDEATNTIGDVTDKLKAIRKNYYSFTRWKLYKRNYKYIFIAHILLLHDSVQGTKFFQEIRVYLNIKEEAFSGLLSYVQQLNQGEIRNANHLLMGHKELESLTYFSEELNKQATAHDDTGPEVLVVATMSAGKSTFINSIIGKDLLPSKNEACTAKVISLTNRVGLPFYVGYKTSEPSKFDSFVDRERLSKWNEDDKEMRIYLEGQFSTILPLQSNLTIVDTPGPNNSMDRQHSAVTLELLAAKENSHIFYLLNAANMATDDDRELLLQVLKHVPKVNWSKEITFIINRMDEIDMEMEESIDGVIENATTYLTSLGIKDPRIIPYSSRASLLLQKALHEEDFTRKERLDMENYLELYQDETSSLAKRSTVEFIEAPMIEAVIDRENVKVALENCGLYSVIHCLRQLTGIPRQNDVKESISV
ncbi:dynamin family protein [Saccharococcus sp. Marseille-Q5394]|uniref:dynamin family protein n=1 Tax=Saccharococcus sp. Marseille-Q5394 TaxID=2972778 RepID=UPI0021C58D46|nr:dynamin family protein [Saccharococcus sp. Marseille-Q5394]